MADSTRHRAGPGRHPLLTPEQSRAASTLVADGTPVREVARTFGISVSSVYRTLEKERALDANYRWPGSRLQRQEKEIAFLKLQTEVLELKLAALQATTGERVAS